MLQILGAAIYTVVGAGLSTIGFFIWPLADLC